MIMNNDITALLANTKKLGLKATLVIPAGVLSSVLLATGAQAASEITINQPATSTTTVVEQYSDGNTAVITATPNGISMRDGMPFSVTQVNTSPRYTVQRGAATVTSVPVMDQSTNRVSRVDVVGVPMTTTTSVTPMTTNDLQVVTTQSATPLAVSTPANAVQTISTKTITLDTLQLQPTFSTPDLVSANTKIMKIMKNSNGREVAVPANNIAPGDVIEYHTTYVNNSAQPVNDLNAMVSLPSGVQLVSLNSPLPTFATTGGNSYQTIEQVGNTVVVKENYSGLKWSLVDLDSNAPKTVVIRAKVQ